MRPLTELDADALNLAHDSAAVLARFRTYLPPGGLLMANLARFQNEVREAAGMEAGQHVGRGRDLSSLDELTSAELDALCGATGTLVDRFGPFMENPVLPDLLRGFREALRAQKAERADLRASVAPVGA